MQVEPSTRFANRALDSGERFLRRRTLYPAELKVHISAQTLVSHEMRKMSSLPALRFGSHARKKICQRQSPWQQKFLFVFCGIRSASRPLSPVYSAV